jgi:hypothetical protein
MHLDYDGGNTLHEAVGWSKFLSITLISGIGLVLLLVLLGGELFQPFIQSGRAGWRPSYRME